MKAIPVIVLALVLATAAARPPGAPATPGDAEGDKSGSNWLRWYADACDSLRLAAQDCSLCHVTVQELNPYGEDLLLVNNEPWLIGNLDSDGDGVTNDDEIDDCTGPGWFDPPLAAPTETWGAFKMRWR